MLAHKLWRAAQKRGFACYVIYFMADNEILKIPEHVGLIMDGNRRWAKKRLLPVAAGHAQGMKKMIAVAEKAKELGVRYLTVYALSTENLDRPAEELDKMFELIKKNFLSSVKKLNAMGASLKIMGDLSLLPSGVREVVEKGAEQSEKNAEFTFIMALCYGARNEIVNGVNRAVRERREVTEAEFSRLLYSDGVPDPDFIIRTGGELRLSNFLLWQCAYAELYFTDTLFPDFTGAKFVKAIQSYSSRVRRFGKI